MSNIRKKHNIDTRLSGKDGRGTLLPHRGAKAGCQERLPQVPTPPSGLWGRTATAAARTPGLRGRVLLEFSSSGLQPSVRAGGTPGRGLTVPLKSGFCQH